MRDCWSFIWHFKGEISHRDFPVVVPPTSEVMPYSDRTRGLDQISLWIAVSCMRTVVSLVPLVGGFQATKSATPWVLLRTSVGCRKCRIHHVFAMNFVTYHDVWNPHSLLMQFHES